MLELIAFANAGKELYSMPGSGFRSIGLPTVMVVLTVFLFCGRSSAEKASTKPAADEHLKSVDNCSGTLARASTNLRKGLYKAAIDECSRCLKSNPRSGEAFLIRAEARLLDNQRDEAIADAVEASRLIPNMMAPYFIEVQALLIAHTQESGIAECRYMAPDAPQPSALFLARGLLHVLAGNSRAALNDFDTGLSQSPPRPLEAWLLGSKFGAYKSRHEEDQAWDFLADSKTLFAQQLKEHPNDLSILFLRGAVSDFSGTQSNPSDFAVLLQKNPGPMLKYYATHMIASEESEKGHYAKAVALLQQNTKLWPQHPNSHLLLAACYARLGNHQAVMDELTKLHSINPFFAVTYGQRAGYYGSLGKIPAVVFPGVTSSLNPNAANANVRKPKHKSSGAKRHRTTGKGSAAKG